jgi:uncharacterized protein (DUF4415 family)
VSLRAVERRRHSHHFRSEGDTQRAKVLRRSDPMKKEYDFSKLKSSKNPYAAKLKRQVTIRMGDDVIGYFKEMAEDTGIPYQSLINLYLRDCAIHHRKIKMEWVSE